jgi:hypothetical protein
MIGLKERLLVAAVIIFIVVVFVVMPEIPIDPCLIHPTSDCHGLPGMPCTPHDPFMIHPGMLECGVTYDPPTMRPIP